MKPLLLIFILTIIVSAQSVKEGKAITQWMPVGHAPDIRKRAEGATPLPSDAHIEGTGTMELSFANVKRSGDTLKGWVRFVFPTSAIVVEGKWNEVRFYTVCDCQKNDIKVLTGIAYELNGTVRAEQVKQVLEHTVPGSMGRQIFEFFCERGGLPTVSPPTLKPSQ